MVSTMVSTLQDFNNAIDNILVHNASTDSLHGRVCAVCDEFMELSGTNIIGLKTFMKYVPLLLGDPSLPDALHEYYTLKIPHNNNANSTLKNALLSPNSMPFYNSKRLPCIMCCNACKHELRSKKTPKYAIASNLTIGMAPPCLQALNEIELALLSQARFRGHLFTYWGGCHRSIKGWHSFYDVDPNYTNAVLQQVSHVTENKNIAVVLCGPFTPEQKEKVLSKVEVDTEKIQIAFAWLKQHNHLYAYATMPQLGPITIINNSREVESENSDIEIKEEIKVIFPDSTIHTGGCNDYEEFQQALAEIRSTCPGAIPFVTSRPSSRILRDYKDMNLMKAFPKQFPYGYGYHEDFNVQCSVNGFLKHLLMLSLPALHEATFVLVIHNMYEKSRALAGSFWQVKGGKEKCNVSEQELNSAISRQLHGLPPIHTPGQKFLDSVKAVKRHLAHTNNSAQAAQAKFLSLTHHFGCPTVLFTVSFDDSLDIRILPLSGHNNVVQWISNLESLSPQRLNAEMELLKALRLQYPGICALNFEFLLNIVLDKIVGDNPLRVGIFGKLAAFALAVEEQGRKTLHAHIIVFTLGWNETLRRLQSSNPTIKKQAEDEVIAFVDSILSTELCPGLGQELMCSECNQSTLNFLSGQELRNLRHKIGSKTCNGIIAKCPNCLSSFRGNQIALQKAMPQCLTGDLHDEEIHSMVSLQVLKATSPFQSTVASNHMIALNNYRFNHHLDQHTKTCWKKGDEARCKLPDIHEPKTRIMFSETPYETFLWNGSKKPIHNITIRPHRFPHDAFTNVHCVMMSSCHAPCNSNIGVTTGARATIYASCYSAKATQKEDCSEYNKMASYVGNRFQTQVKENTLFEGLSRLMGAVIVGTSEHVCAAPMAAFLVRNGSRFKFSVNFKYVPLREFRSILSEEEDTPDISDMPMTILSHDTGCFMTNEALNYFHRPKCLNDLCVIDFFTEYEVIRKRPTKNERETFELDNEDHPGFMKQVVRKRNPENPVLPQFSHWAFPDTASFDGNIFEVDQSNTHIENFCQTVLILFQPF
jgi:Helitron helicase-like domain at N-terminus